MPQATNPVGGHVLDVNDKQAIDDLVPRVTDLDWETGQFAFSEFVENFELPQIVQSKTSWSGLVPVDRYLYLHSAFERYAITATAAPNQNLPNKCLLSDWYKGTCRITSEKPVLKTRWWVFQSAFELFRFDFPRTVKILAEVPVHRRCSDRSEDPWIKAVLKRNVFLKAIRKCTYQSVMSNGNRSEAREGFVLADFTGGEYLIPPAVPLRFSTEIMAHELQDEYKSHEGDFTIPEILMRYEFPIDVSLSLPGSNTVNLTLNSFCAAKSILGIMFGQRDEPEVIELSPETPLFVLCPSCLTAGIPRDDEEESMQVEAAPDSAEMQRYSSIVAELSKQMGLRIESYKGAIREAREDELAGVQRAYTLSIDIEKDVKAKTGEPVYMTPDEAIKFMDGDNDGFLFDCPQPKTFIVHICVDPANPYNETVDYELMEEDSTADITDGTAGAENGQVRARVREAMIMQYEMQDPIPRQYFIQTLNDIPNELLVSEGPLPDIAS